MENIDFWQTFVSAVVSFVFTIISMFKQRKN